MDFLKGVIHHSETVLFRFTISPWVFAPYVGASVGLTLGAIILPALVVYGLSLMIAFSFLAAYLRWFSTDAALTRRRMIHTTGLVSRQVTEIGLNRIESVQIRQGIIGRLCGYGDLIVSGTGIGNIVIGGVADPMTTRVGILDAQQVAQTTPVGSPLT